MAMEPQRASSMSKMDEITYLGCQVLLDYFGPVYLPQVR